MAAEVPVKDVLCEAMEYLSKLGSNLRNRTENLKEKKINKDKLNNALALQKAASKVLLICELSKKSLENVETGVRKILERVDTSQAALSDGGNSSRSNTKRSHPENPHYYTFEYKSRKLRIKKKVNVKHYMSVKVFAKKMPASMLEKYPVYHDCKLYRIRKKRNQRIKSNSESDNRDKSNNEHQRDASFSEDRTQEKSEKTNKPERQPSKSHSRDHKKSLSTSRHVDDSPSRSEEKERREESLSKSTKHRTSVDSVNDKEVDNRKEKDSSDDKEQISKTSKKNGHRSSLDKKSDKVVDKHLGNDSSSDADNLPKSKTSHRKEIKKKRVVIESSEDEEITNKDASELKPVSDDDINSANEERSFKKKDKDIEKTDESDVNDPNIKITEKLHKKLDDSNDSVKEPQLKKQKLNQNDEQPQNEKNNEVVTLDSSDEHCDSPVKNNEPEKIENNQKPMIKVVSLEKLLKPDALQMCKLVDNKAKDKESEETKIGDRSFQMKKKRMEKEDKYWSEKRKQVKAFKPKKFTINVIRLPTLSKYYLEGQQLKRVTQNGKTICEIDDENQPDESLNNEQPVTINNELFTETNQVKSSLLNESDSDGQINEEATKVRDESLNKEQPVTSNNELIAETNQVKSSLLNESDSDGQINEEATKVRDESLNKEQPVTSNNELITETNQVKSSLLNESDSDGQINEEATKVRDESLNKEQPVTSNNELIAETNQVKSSLLNESDSDGTINEEATKVKDALLKDSDSDSFGDKDSGSTNENEVSSFKNKREKDSLFKNSDSNQQKTSDENEQAKLKIMGSDSDNRENESDKNNEVNEKDVESDKQNDKCTEDQGDNGEVNTNQSLLNESEDQDAKESLLNNSSDDKTSTPLKQRRESKSVTPQSKKKHIRESVHAKKMLLTYSSSSDTDDEQLKTVIKEIKKSLLKEISDDDTKKRESPEKESDSDGEDIIKKMKRKNENSDSEKERRKQKKQKRAKDGGSGSSEVHSSSRRKMVRSKSKPGNCSSSQNSDARDSNEREIDGLTNLNTLNKVRRRNSDDSDQTRKSMMSVQQEIKRSGLIDGEILPAESDSDVTNDENDAVEDLEEDLPTVTMSFNGDAIDHLGKEDLLVESDSSMSHNENEKNSETNKEESEEEEKVNSKRRKAIAISSDSEVGSSRKKDKDVRLSDFEDTEDENSEPVKKSKRKKKGSESDASQDSSNEGGKKKRRRIKTMDSDASGSDTENEGRNKHGRKNIRKVMGKNQLEEATKKAAREEKERIARIAERQKLYNNLEFDESGKPDEVVLEKVVLDFDPETKEPLIEVDRGLVKKLKPHQANGIKFMWNACFESVKRIKKDKGSGCILAHCMGLGKTLQVVSLTHTLLTHRDLTGVNRVLVVCPLSTVLNWVNEFRMWLKHAESDYDLDVYELSRFKQNSERAFQLSQWLEHGGVCVLGYEMFRNLSADNSKKFKKKMLKIFQEALVDPGPDLVVCDEGHLLKNEKTSLSQSMNRVKTLRRIVLTGTPLQNNLKEYYCMVQFVKPNLLGKYNEYLNRFVNPITNGQYTDSTEADIKVMKRRSHVLHKMLDGAVQRRDYGVLAPFLPPKHEYVLFITLTEIQIKLYQYYLDNYSRRPLAGKSSGFLFPDFQSLQRIWTHPLVLKYNSDRYEIMQQKKREREEEDSEGSLVDFIDDDSTPDESSSDESSDDMSDMSDDSRKKKKKKSAKKSKGKDSKGGSRRGTRANPLDQADDENLDEDVVEVKNDNPTEWWIKMVTDDEIEDMRNSHKLILLFDILRQCETIGDKLLVFSQSLYSLDLIEHFLGKVDEATQEGRIDEKLGGHVGSWSPGVDYFRLDGSTSCENRSIWCKNFNREDNPRARLFLISTRAGGLGINLVAANRVVIFDVSWNPSHDVQSIFRVYRFGQKKPCYVYRFLAMGTMEEKIYERQVTKQAISKRVIDEQQIDRHYAENDLAELYKFEPTPPSPRPLPPLPKDRLFAEMLKEHEAQIYKYHEHDSLLENKEEETLSEEERKAAWEDFENEKNRPPPAPFPTAWPMHNGMVPSLLAQQQQQLAYAALAAMLRKDMPNINDNQIRDMIPLIYNSNPGMFGGYDYGLMQKMSEIYKYAPGMLNPMMAGNVMNTASGAGAMSGMGGTSGLQYEPPWQRQQQLRLQQIMQQQQQNQMGAKLYAGGLGSRDPVAMAMQQARAREIMLGGGAAGGGGAGAGRPRGRPPMQPRAPPAAVAEPGDVVNLDSD